MKAVRIEVLAVYAGMLLIGHSAFGQDGEAERLLADGDKLAWLKNWQAAEPFFEKAEILFRERGDKRNELYARRPFWTTPSRKMTLAFGFGA